jgi:uncharacterized protein YcfJ
MTALARHARSLLVLLVTVAAPADGRAQHAQRPSGQRVRVTAPTAFAKPFVGTLAGYSADSLSVAMARGGARVVIPRDAVRQLEVSEGRARRRYAALGGILGLVAGAVIGGEAASTPEDPSLAGLAGMIAGGLLGASAGAAIGAVVAPERWRHYYLPREGGS